LKLEAVDTNGKLAYIKASNLRCSFAIHLLKSGIDLRYIQEFLEHKSSKTTESYTRVSTKNLSAIKIPLDSLLRGDENMSERTKNTGHPKGCIHEQFAYLPNLMAYPNSSDMNELGESEH